MRLVFFGLFFKKTKAPRVCAPYIGVGLCQVERCLAPAQAGAWLLSLSICLEPDTAAKTPTMQEVYMGANAKFKDNMFSKLFRDPDILRELYCALSNVSLPQDIPVTINTLDDVLIIDKFNDVSFEIGGKIIVLIEHQSTINNNMPVRLLIYIAHIYEKMIKDKKIYAFKRVPLPTPEFYVFYNGEEPYPDVATLKLSDAFEKLSDMGLGLPEKGFPLELEVKVININKGKNAELARKCETLAGYSVFVDKVREYKKAGMTLEEAIKKAVEYCLEHDILKEFLEKNAAGVMDMIYTEWDMETALDVRFEEGREEGREVRSAEVARNALMKGLSIDVIHDITGLDADVINSLRASGN
jgi:predicted transposase/invertase (TIGR01784 family)